MASAVKWSNEEWRRLQTSLFSATGTTRIRLSELSADQWDQVVRETRRSREDIDAALDAMLRRQELPGGRVPVQTTERLFREAVPLLRQVLKDAEDAGGGQVPDARLEKILLALQGFNFASLPYDDLFLVWHCVGVSEGMMEHHECLRCVYSVLGQITHTQVRRMADEEGGSEKQHRHQQALMQHREVNPPSKRRAAKAKKHADAAAGGGGEAGAAAPAGDPLRTPGSRRRLTVKDWKRK